MAGPSAVFGECSAASLSLTGLAGPGGWADRPTRGAPCLSLRTRSGSRQ